MHCVGQDYSVPSTQAPRTNTSEARLIDIIMVRRGKCSYTTKVRVAAQKGAGAVLIIDKRGSGLRENDLRNIIVADDGYGGQIKIPSLLISNLDGEKLIGAVNRSQVIVELNWAIPHNRKASMDLWISSGSPESMRFLKEFANVSMALRSVMHFIPHYAVFRLRNEGANYGDLCSDTSNRFCAEDPDGDGPITGKMVLEEDVRQLCICELFKETVAGGSTGPSTCSRKFWVYVSRFSDFCSLNADDPDMQFGKSCSLRLMGSVGIDAMAVRKCVLESSEEKLQHQVQNTAWSASALRINGMRYSGMVEADLVTRAICSSFDKMPVECRELMHPKLEHHEGHVRPDTKHSSLASDSQASTVSLWNTTEGLFAAYMRDVLHQESIGDVRNLTHSVAKHLASLFEGTSPALPAHTHDQTSPQSAALQLPEEDESRKQTTRPSRIGPAEEAVNTTSVKFWIVRLSLLAALLCVALGIGVILGAVCSNVIKLRRAHGGVRDLAPPLLPVEVSADHELRPMDAYVLTET